MKPFIVLLTALTQQAKSNQQHKIKEKSLEGQYNKETEFVWKSNAVEASKECSNEM